MESISRMGIGLYLGEENDQVDRKMLAVVEHAARAGINAFDCAPCYRNERSERILARFVQNNPERSSWISTKGGFVPFDFSKSRAEELAFIRELDDHNLIKASEFNAEHFQTFDPRYLDFQLDRTLNVLGLSCLEIYYLHNPEYLLEKVGRTRFLEKMRAVFVWLKEKIDQAKIEYIGISSWDGFFRKELQSCLQLNDFMVLSKECGVQDHFKFIQFPFNPGTPDAFFSKTQLTEGYYVSLIRLMEQHGLKAITSAPLGQGKLVSVGLPDRMRRLLPDLSDAQICMTFALCAPFITSTLLGTTSLENLSAMLEVFENGYKDPDLFIKILKC